MSLKFKYKGMMEVEPIPENPDIYVVTKVDHSIMLGQHLDIQTLKKDFTPVYGDTLNLMDPKRNERLCPPILPSPGKANK